MQEMRWLESHIGSINTGISIINEYYWNLDINQQNGNWVVKAGEAVIFVADNQDAVDAFIYGMALAYVIIPDEIKKKFIDDANLP